MKLGKKSAIIGVSLLALTIGGCDQLKKEEAEAPKVITEADAQAFMDRAESKLSSAGHHLERLLWVQSNFITSDTSVLAAAADKDYIELGVKLANEAAKFDDIAMNADLKRKMMMLKMALVLPAPEDAAKTARLAAIKSSLEGTYGVGKFDGKNLGELSTVIAKNRNPDALLAAWDGWRNVSKPMAADYAEMVDIANEGATGLGFKDLGSMWRSNYDMDPDDLSVEADRLWGQVKPLYDSLQCHVRTKLSDYYGDRVITDDGAIPAHLLGNMWAQSWINIYDLVKPENAGSAYDVTELLKAKDYDAKKMAHAADDFFNSMGFDKMPDTFWDRSLFTKPADREVVCHASAWDIDGVEDLRIKMCMEVNGEDFTTVHHEIGHNIYQRAYNKQSYLHQTGAHDGFHEAIGDMIALSITPDYLKKVGLLETIPDASADLSLLMQQALEKVAFLPFGLMVDKWRWQVFSGEVKPEDYNKAWWKLRQEYQGVKSPNERPADAFDPGAKYHIPGNTPYMRYFLAHILQFQFHQSACDQAGWQGPLHRCSVYGNKEVGAKFNAMMEMGASKPWGEALKTFTGSDQMDGSSVVAYFAPLKTWLDEQNKDRKCGW